MKKVLSVILTVLMVTCILPTVSADVDGYYTYSIENGEATIEKVNQGISGDIIIPSELGGAPVTKIGGSAFLCCVSITSVIIPDSVTTISRMAFNSCYELTTVTIPNSVTSIGESAFSCCYKLTSINIPSNVTQIENATFSNCKSLVNVTIPNSVTNIGSFAFNECTTLENIYIPKTVTTIGVDVFKNCNNLSNITVEEGNTNYHSAGNCLIETTSKTLIVGSNNSVIPDDNSVTSIGHSAFYGRNAIANISIPDGVTSIEKYAFWQCTELTDVNIPNSVTSIGAYAFSGCNKLANISIPDNVTDVGSYAFYDTEWLQNQADGVVYIGKVAYIAKGVCDETVYIKDGTVSISSCAFEGSEGYEGIVNLFIPNSVTNISSLAFRFSRLRNIALPKSINYIGYGEFGIIDEVNVWYSGTEEDKSNITFDELDHFKNRFVYANWNYYKLGDVDTDNIIGGPDALATLQASVGKKEITFGQTAAADVDGNGIIETTDALLILQYAVDKIDKFPAE